MTLCLRHVIVSGILASAFWLPAVALAQDSAPVVTARDVSSLTGNNAARSGLFGTAVETRATEFAWRQQRPSRGGPDPVAIGAFIGGAAALAATAAAARAYGENESGRFCGPCLIQWSTFTVPIGAGAGAAIGYGVKRARHSVTALPVFSRQAAAVVVTARF